MSSQAVDISSLTDEEQKIHTTSKMKMFKFTIIVCIFYGLIALSMLLFAVFTQSGSKLLYDDLFPFTMTFIIGTILIIVYLSNLIYNFKPTTTGVQIGYDLEMCPDYWKLETIEDSSFIDEEGISYLNSKLNKNHFKYKCSMDKRLFQPRKFQQLDVTKPENQQKGYQMGNKGEIFVTLNDMKKANVSKPENFDKLKEYAANMNGYSLTDTAIIPNNTNRLTPVNTETTFSKDNVPLDCASVYPMYLSVMDKENAKKNPNEPSNRFRCAYANTCGIPWSEAGCV
jgi:hypothetical protein